MLPQNLYGPMFKKKRLAQNMSIEHLTDLVNENGLSFTPEKVHKIEEQQIKLYDYQIFPFLEAFNISEEEFLSY